MTAQQNRSRNTPRYRTIRRGPAPLILLGLWPLLATPATAGQLGGTANWLHAASGGPERETQQSFRQNYRTNFNSSLTSAMRVTGGYSYGKNWNQGDPLKIMPRTWPCRSPTTSSQPTFPAPRPPITPHPAPTPRTNRGKRTGRVPGNMTTGPLSASTTDKAQQPMTRAPGPLTPTPAASGSTPPAMSAWPNSFIIILPATTRTTLPTASPKTPPIWPDLKHVALSGMTAFRSAFPTSTPKAPLNSPRRQPRAVP